MQFTYPNPGRGYRRTHTHATMPTIDGSLQGWSHGASPHLGHGTQKHHRSQGRLHLEWGPREWRAGRALATTQEGQSQLRQGFPLPCRIFKRD